MLKKKLKKEWKIEHPKRINKKNIREQRRIRIKEEIKEEPRVQMKTHREQAKEEYANSHAI